MPERFSYRWWRLWWSGAIARGPVFFDELAKRLEAAKIKDSWYFEHESPERIRRGERLETFSRGLLDMAAAVSQDLHLPWSSYQSLTTQLFGAPANVVDDHTWGQRSLMRVV